MIELPDTCHSPPARLGRDLPDAGSPGFVELNDSFQAENRSQIGHDRPFSVAAQLSL
jgi:hypothetical protein